MERAARDDVFVAERPTPRRGGVSPPEMCAGRARAGVTPRRLTVSAPRAASEAPIGRIRRQIRFNRILLDIGERRR
jgi:hypothetical protein